MTRTTFIRADSAHVILPLGPSGPTLLLSQQSVSSKMACVVRGWRHICCIPLGPLEAIAVQLGAKHEWNNVQRSDGLRCYSESEEPFARRLREGHKGTSGNCKEAPCCGRGECSLVVGEHRIIAQVVRVLRECVLQPANHALRVGPPRVYAMAGRPLPLRGVGWSCALHRPTAREVQSFLLQTCCAVRK